MFISRNWEMFYTHVKRNEDLIDLLYIDRTAKWYIFGENLSWLASDGVDDEREEYSATYISRLVFDIIVKGLQENGYKQLL